MKLGNKKRDINYKSINKKPLLIIFSVFLALALSFSVSAKTTYINPAADTNLSINNTIFIADRGNVELGDIDMVMLL